MNFYPCGDDGPSSPPQVYCRHPYHTRDLRPVSAKPGHDYCPWHLSRKGYLQDLAVFQEWVAEAEDKLKRRKEWLRDYKKAAARARRKG